MQQQCTVPSTENPHARLFRLRKSPKKQAGTIVTRRHRTKALARRRSPGWPNTKPTSRAAAPWHLPAHCSDQNLPIARIGARPEGRPHCRRSRRKRCMLCRYLFIRTSCSRIFQVLDCSHTSEPLNFCIQAATQVLLLNRRSLRRCRRFMRPRRHQFSPGRPSADRPGHPPPRGRRYLNRRRTGGTRGSGTASRLLHCSALAGPRARTAKYRKRSPPSSVHGRCSARVRRRKTVLDRRGRQMVIATSTAFSGSRGIGCSIAARRFPPEDTPQKMLPSSDPAQPSSLSFVPGVHRHGQVDATIFGRSIPADPASVPGMAEPSMWVAGDDAPPGSARLVAQGPYDVRWVLWN